MTGFFQITVPTAVGLMTLHRETLEEALQRAREFLADGIEPVITAPDGISYTFDALSAAYARSTRPTYH